MKRLTKLSVVGAAVLSAASVANADDNITLAPNSAQPHRPSRQLDGAGFSDDVAKSRSNKGVGGTYIVQLKDAPLATYAGGIEGLAATSPKATKTQRLNTKSKASIAYSAFLTKQHQKFAAQAVKVLGRSVEAKHTYRHAFNGMALELTPDEAKRLRTVPGVLRVEKERIEKPQDDVGPMHIGADRIWRARPRWDRSKGEGVVVAVLDTGINSDHPAFADIGGDGYDHTNPLGSGNYVPGSHCDSNPSFCNDKLIGAWSFVQGPADPLSPEDSDGHGSHTAGTAVGNVDYSATIGAPTTSFTRTVSGVAPHANLIIYDVCVESCPGSALLAAIDQVVVDAAALPNGIQSLNYSISGGDDPYNDAVELGFLNATAAGIFVSASAGNSGPGASTNAHNGPWVSTVAALTHGREIDNALTNFSSDGDALSDILGAGLTSGYGPAPIVYAGDFPTNNGSANDTDPAQCLEPFPAGTFSGEIVVCDRGAIARVDKGANVLAGGAGGFVLANTAAEGESIVADPHFLPGVHVGFTDGEALRTWLANNTNTVATISGYAVNIVPEKADIMASFSSRGPNTGFDVLKPDVGAPGVAIMAPINNGGAAVAPEYGFLSGTSMSSPHNAGAGALLSAIRPWTPYEIRSALMMTARGSATEAATRGHRRQPITIFDEDGVTPSDAFDTGAGRIDVGVAKDSGLVLDESPANFLAADPAAGGDPKSLNIASMQDSACVDTCSWTRTVRNVTGHSGSWDLSVIGPGAGKYSVSPRRLKVRRGGTAQITVTANTASVPTSWDFAELSIRPRHRGPDLHMPIAAFTAKTTLPGVFQKSASTDTAVNGDVVTYTIDVVNGQLAGETIVTDPLAPNLELVSGSLTETSAATTVTSPFQFNGATNQLEWSGELTPAGLTVAPSAAPFGFFSISNFVSPAGCPANCDDGAWVYNVPAFTFNGQSYNQVVLSVNGTIEAGNASGLAASSANQNFPDPNGPNNLIAPLWTDLDMGTDGDGAEWYVGVFNIGLPDTVTVYEWNNVPLFGDTSNRYSFQIWVQNGTSGNIWFTYGQLGTTTPPSGMTVGVENADGTVGGSYFFEGVGTAPSVGQDLGVQTTPGGSVQLTYQARVKNCRRKRGSTIVNTARLHNGGNPDERAIAVVECTAN